MTGLSQVDVNGCNRRSRNTDLSLAVDSVHNSFMQLGKCLSDVSTTSTGALSQTQHQPGKDVYDDEL